MKTLKIFFGLVLMTAMSACGEMCTTCTYSFDVGGQRTEVTQPEFCGSRSEVSDYKDAAQDAAEAAATLGGGVSATAACVDN